MKSSPEGLSPDIEKALAALALIDRQRAQGELVARAADLEGRKAEVSAALRGAYARRGKSISEDTIAQGLEAYFSRRLAFTPSELGAAAFVASTWIQRGSILKWGFIVLGCAVVVALAGEFLVLRPRAAAREAEYRQSQLAWANASNQMDQAEARVALILKGAQSDITKVPQSPDPALAAAVTIALNELRQIAAEVQKITLAAQPFRHAVELSLDQRVRAGPEATSLPTLQLSDAEKRLNQQAGRIDAIVNRCAKLQRESEELATAYAEFMAAKPSGQLEIEGRAERDLASAAIREFKAPDDVARYRIKLQRATAQVTALADLPEQIRATARRVAGEASDQPTLALGNSLEGQALAAVAAGNVATAQREFAALSDLAAKLEQEFTLRIVNQPNEYTRIWTYKNNNHAMKSYYIVVQAIGPDGRPVPMNIRSEEDGSVATVNLWAERVEQTVYEAVGRDKQDDGIVEDDTFAQKQRGRVDPQYLMGPKSQGGDISAGRIYRWPRKT